MNTGARNALLLAGLGIGSYLLYRKLTAFSFRNKVVLITGGSRGLGLVLARKLTQEGAKIAILARNEDELNRAADNIARIGSRPYVVKGDVTGPEDCATAIEMVLRDVGPIDVLINNAGIIQVGPVSRFSREDYEAALATNFWGPFNTIEAVLPHMRRAKAGRIVNISSIGGKIGIPHLLPYSVSKFALVGYSTGLRAELANNGITVTTVCPGLIRTGSARHADFKGQHEAEYAWFKLGSSLPLLTMSAERAADQILNACRHGNSEVVLSLPAKLAVTFHDLFPEAFCNLASLANRMMPRPADSGMEMRKGLECETPLTRSPLAFLTDQAAMNNNELSPSV